MNPFTKKEKQATEPLESQQQEEKEFVEEKEDRTIIYNCLGCLGEGLVYEGTRTEKCPKCNGTGKIN